MNAAERNVSGRISSVLIADDRLALAEQQRHRVRERGDGRPDEHRAQGQDGEAEQAALEAGTEERARARR